VYLKFSEIVAENGRPITLCAFVLQREEARNTVLLSALYSYVHG
jgi:hypothetical protein